MGEPKEEDLYRNFSRKDLQGLCKKYGLPAKKSNSEMATSLILYLEKKNLCSRAIWEGTRSDFFASEMTKLQAGMKMNSSDDQRKDCGRIASHSGPGNFRRRNHKVTEKNDMQKCKEFASSNKASDDIGNLTQLQRESNSGVAIQENTFSSVVSSSTFSPSPTFTYEVSCEDGIQLFVDLNSTASDWIENLKSGIHVCHHLHNPISQSFHQDNINLINCSKEKNIMDQSNDADVSSLDNQGQTDELDGLKVLSDAFNSLDNSKEKEVILSSKLDSDTNNGKLTGITSSRSEETLTGICHYDFKGKSVLSDPQCSGFPVDQGQSTGNGTTYENASTSNYTEMQASKCATLSPNFDNSLSKVDKGVDFEQPTNNEVVKSVQLVDKSKIVSSSPLMSSCSLGNPDIRISEGQTHSTENSPRTREAGKGIDENEKKDDELHSCCNGGPSGGPSGGPIDPAIPVKNDGDNCNLSELNEDDTGIIPSATHLRKLHTRDPGKGSNGLKCMKYKDQLGIPSKRPAGSESNSKLKRKKHGNGIEGRSKFVNSKAKILRSSKQFVGDVHSKRRRSSRLVIK